MATLENLQSYFQDYLIKGSTSMLPFVADDSQFSAENRLLVYFNAYRIRLLEIMKLDFEKTHTLMGDEVFEQAFDAYLEAHTSEHFSVRYFGQYFPKFLTQTAPFNAHGVFAEMAYFEWSLSHTLDAKDEAILKHDTLTKLSPEEWPGLCLRFHPSVISQYFAWNTPELWKLIDENDSPRPPTQQPVALRWVFWRKGLRSYFQSCNDYEDILFDAISQNKDFSEICESLLSVLPEEEVPLKAAQTLNRWVQEELLIL